MVYPSNSNVILLKHLLALGTEHNMKKILTGALLAVATLPFVVLAQGDFSNVDTALDTLITWIGRLIPFLLLLATLYFFWGLTKFILKAGNEEAQGEAKQIMIWGVVALFVLISFWGLVGFLSNTFGLDADGIDVSVAPDISDIIPPTN